MKATPAASERFSNLRDLLRDWTDLVVRMKRKSEKFASQKFLLSLAYVGPLYNVENQDLATLAEESGLNREKVAGQLSAILNGDAHLKATCGDHVTLLFYLDRFFISDMANLEASGGPAPFAERYDSFIDSTYNTVRFKRHCYLHLFNFSSPVPSLEFDGIRIIKLDL